MKLFPAVGVALALLMIPVGFVNASGVDPTIIINNTPHDATDFNGGTLNTTIVNGTLNFLYTGAVPLTSLTISFKITTFESFSCFSDIFVDCSIGFNPITDFISFDFSGGPGTCLHNNPPGGTCPGEILPDTGFSIAGSGFGANGQNVTISGTPEPGTLLLLLSGLGPVIGFSRRRWGSRSAA